MSATGYRPQTIAAMLARATIALAKQSASPRSDAQALMAHVVGKGREWVVAHGESFLSKAHGEKFSALCDLRAEGTPMAYVVGSAGFFGRDFLVNDAVLVPRPETEHLVDAALAYLRGRFERGEARRVQTVLDVGTGSGAIACTIACEVANVSVDGIDISEPALRVADANAQRLNVRARCKFTRGDLAAPVLDRVYDVLVANLPYIPSADVPVPPEAAGFEPRVALDGGADGLVQYRRLMPQAARIVRPGGVFLAEGAPPVMDGLLALARASFPDAAVAVEEDYAGLARYVRVDVPRR